MSRRRRFKQNPEPQRCPCSHVADTPEFQGADGRRRAGLTGRGGAHHGNPFTHKDGCIHSELQHTTRPAPKKLGAKRLRLQ